VRDWSTRRLGDQISTADPHARASRAFADIVDDGRCTLMVFRGDADPVYLLVGIHPALNLSTLNPLNSARVRRMQNRFANYLRQFDEKPSGWPRADGGGSAPDASGETVQRSVAVHGTRDKARTAAKRPPSVSPSLGYRPKTANARGFVQELTHMPTRRWQPTRTRYGSVTNGKRPTPSRRPLSRRQHLTLTASPLGADLVTATHNKRPEPSPIVAETDRPAGRRICVGRKVKASGREDGGARPQRRCPAQASGEQPPTVLPATVHKEACLAGTLHLPLVLAQA
jgi:putative transposase